MQLHSLKLTFAPLKIGQAPKGNDRIANHPFSDALPVSFREGKTHPIHYHQKDIGNSSLVGGFNPIEKYARQNGNLPQLGVNIKNI